MSKKIDSELFSVSPKKLIFYAPYIHTQKRLVTILNPTGQRLLYKIRTNAPTIYTAVANCGWIEPYDITEFFINLHCLNLKSDEEQSHRICVQCIKAPDNDNIEADAILRTFKRIRHHVIQNVRVSIELRPEPIEIPQTGLDVLLQHDIKKLFWSKIDSMPFREVTTISKTQNSRCRAKCIMTVIFIILTGLLTGELQPQLA